MLIMYSVAIQDLASCVHVNYCNIGMSFGIIIATYLYLLLNDFVLLILI